MRGTRNINPRRTFRMGIIPAYAGNTGRDRIRLHPPRDHPRICGEHHGAVEPRNCHPGSSPRMRGTRQLVGWRTPESGIIPAYAGNTRAQPASLPANWDHPRVCGEHSTSSKPPDVMSGSSPRMRGTRSWRDCRAARAGIIPAYAGNTDSFPPRHARHGDHPRVCGEHHMTSIMVHLSWGSSPRMRGTQSRCRPCMRRTGIIPAYAGNTRPALARRSIARDHPRVCGEHPP